jgi:PAS domain S-box-containing protein
MKVSNEKMLHIDAITDTVVICDLETRVRAINKAIEERLAERGIKAEEVIGKPVIECFPFVRREDAEKYANLIKEVLEKGRAGPIEVVSRKGWLSIAAFRLTDADNNPIGFFTIGRDITSLKLAEREVKKSAEQMRYIYEGSKELALVLEPDEIYNRILGIATKAMGADGGSVMIYDEKNRELVVVAAAGTRKEIVMGKRFKIGERFAGRAAERMNALFMHDVEEEPWFKELYKFEVIKSGMSIPLVVRGRLVGILNLKRTEKEEKFLKEDVSLAGLFGGYAAAAIERARLLKALTESKNQLERTRAELEEKIKELEEFHDLVVGRELKMKEMEAELERLRAELEKK